MSVRFSYFDLYRTIVDNDIEKLDDAILFLGPKVHEILLWVDLTATGYAARLGHAQQVEVLLRDLAKYGSERRNQVKSAFRELIPWHEDKACGKFLQNLLAEYPDLAGYARYGELLDVLVSENALGVLLDIMKMKKLSITDILKACVEQGKAKLFCLICESCLPEEDETKQSLRSRSMTCDPVATSIMMGDLGEFSRQLTELTSNENELGQSNRRSTFPYSGSSKSRCPIYYFKEQKRLACLDVSDIVIKTDDVDVFKVLTDPEMISKILLQMKDSTYLPQHATELFDSFMILALEAESVKIIEFLLVDTREEGFVDLDQIDWDLAYVSLLAEGKVKSAGAIPHLRKVGNEDKEVLQMYQTRIITYVLHRMLEQKKTMTIELADQLVTELGSFFRKFSAADELSEILYETLRKLPLVNGRPDLVEPFKKYGIQYTDIHVLRSMNKRVRKESTLGMDVRKKLLALAKAPWELFLDEDIDEDCCVNYEQLRSFYLGEGEGIQLKKFIKFTDKSKTVLKECIALSGLMFHVTDLSTLYYDESKEFLEGLETARRSSKLSLQKLCRLTIRRTIKTATNGRVSSSILSLYLDKSLPKRLVKYLSYREDPEGLYYKLVAVGRGKSGSKELSYTVTEQEDGEDDFYYASDYEGFHEDYDPDELSDPDNNFEDYWTDDYYRISTGF